MSAFNQEIIGSDQHASPPATAGCPQSVQPCNFRAAGRLSNENTRALTEIHETFARNLASALTGYVGSDLKVKLVALDQIPVREYVASVPALSYVASFPVSAVSGVLILECDSGLILPVIDLLLGGTGVAAEKPRDLSEIEGVIMQDLMSLIGRQTVSAWGMPESPLSVVVRMESGILHSLFPANEKATVVKFELKTAGITGTIQLIFPGSLVNVLIKQYKVVQPQKKGTLRFFPPTNIRERILDCDVIVAADLPSMRVSVRDLVGLQPGCVLKLRAPVRSPAMLTVAGREIFEAVPVRNGAQKAAQIGRLVQPARRGGE